MLRNYHTHTYRCGHATGTEEEYIQAAIKAGMKTIGFAEHAPYTFGETGHYSSFRIPEDGAADYVYTLQQLKTKYAGKIQVLVGFETEYYPAYFASFLEKISPLPYDYLILGQHFIGNEIGELHATKITADIDYLTRYIDQLIKGLKTGMFSLVAHPDMLKTNVSPVQKKEQLLRLCRAAKSLSIPLEINLHGLGQRRHYPSAELFEAMAESRCDVILGVDAHSPDELSDSETRILAKDVVRKYSLNLVDVIPFPPRADQ